MTTPLQALKEARECECDMRTKLVGDGCAVCNPEYWAKYLSDDPPEAPHD